MEQKKNNINILLGLNIKNYRHQKGVTQEELGFMTGLHRTYIGHIERAEKNITIRNIEKIANSLDVDVKSLLDFSNLKK